MCFFFFQAEDGIRDLVRSRGLGDVYKRQAHNIVSHTYLQPEPSGGNYSANIKSNVSSGVAYANYTAHCSSCLLYTSDAADERSSVDLGGRRIIKKKNIKKKCTIELLIYYTCTISTRVDRIDE